MPGGSNGEGFIRQGGSGVGSSDARRVRRSRVRFREVQVLESLVPGVQVTVVYASYSRCKLVQAPGNFGTRENQNKEVPVLGNNGIRKFRYQGVIESEVQAPGSNSIRKFQHQGAS